MAITPRLEIKQSQSLLMTPELRQAINLLQLNNLELAELVEQELASNPLLEKEDEHLAGQPDDFAPTIDDLNTAPEPAEEEFKPDIDYDTGFDDDFASDREGYDIESDYSWSDYNKSKDRLSADADFDYCEQKVAGTKSLHQFLSEQIGIRFTSPADKLIAGLLTENLDAAGYFRGDIKEIASRLKTTPGRIENILEALKGFEPSGIFAQDLSECLAIQLKDRNRYDPAIAKLLENLPLLAAGKFKELQQICRCDSEDLASMIADIKSLDPKPAAGWEHDVTAYVIPDVFVRRLKDGDYRVELNTLSLPKVLVNHSYYSQLLKQDKSAKRYLKENLSSANFLIRAMHQRASTILRVSEEIVRTQREFFEHGIEKLKPLSLKDVAYNLEMHESTVSRVTSRKYMHTPRGLFELKFFFSAAAGSYTGNEDVSTLAIKHKIKQLISGEDAQNILSDDKIGELLAREGIKIARRTVAKYRESLNIPTSAERKRRAASAGLARS